MLLLEKIRAICKRIITTLRLKLSEKTAQGEFRYIKKPAKDAEFAVWLKYYMDVAGLSQNKLAQYARLNQSTVNKIAHGRCERTSMDILVAIILVLQLSDRQAKDLISRIGRAFSPCDKRHQYYLKLIAIYHYRERTIHVDDETFLDDADKYLKKYGFDPLPGFEMSLS